MSRVGIVGLWHETNTYSSHPATLDDFAACELLEGDAIVERHREAESVIGGFLHASRNEVVPIFSAGAWPSGPAAVTTVDHLIDRLGDMLERAGELDGVLVNLHGAMVAEDHPDMEADTLEVVRASVGDIPVVCVLDFHANPSVRFVELADVVISYDTYPHVDMFDRGREAVVMLDRLLAGERLKTRIGKHPLLTMPLAQGTEVEPMQGIVQRARRTAEELGVARVCVAGGFPYSDVDRAGISLLATAEEGDDEACRRLVEAVLADIDAVADGFTVARPGPREAVSAALASDATPVVLADIADNIGGGSAGDGTAILAELFSQNAQGALAVIADTEIALEAHTAGVGGHIEGLLGGKTDDLHGPPIPIAGTVVALSDGTYRSQGSWGAGLDVSSGRTAWLSVEGVDLVVTEFARPPFHIEQVTHLGVTPATASIIVAKGALAWKAAYGDIARTVIEVDGPGVCPADLTTLPRTTRPVRYP